MSSESDADDNGMRMRLQLSGLCRSAFVFSILFTKIGPMKWVNGELGRTCRMSNNKRLKIC